MQNRVEDHPLYQQPKRRQGTLAASAVSIAFVLALTGCTSTLKKHVVAFSNVTAPVVDQAEAAYNNAEKLHDIRVDYDAVVAFDDKSQVYNPRSIEPLLSQHDIQVRLTLLEALQCYAQSLTEIASSNDSPALDTASKSVGASMGALGNTVAPAFQSAAATSTTSTGPMTAGVQNTIAASVDALGQYLVARKVKSDLPPIIRRMDPVIEALCKLLTDDIAILDDQGKRDFDSIINRQTLFIRQADQTAHPPLDAQTRREQIMKLPEIVRQQRTTEAQLTELKAALVRLELTHHALATEAQGNNPEALTAKIGDLAAAGSSLGKFYSTVPSSSAQ